jgi:hypothetical protein
LIKGSVKKKNQYELLKEGVVEALSRFGHKKDPV